MTRVRKISIAVALTLLAVAGIAATQVSIVVIQPIGALPEGRTLVVSRLTNTNFVDSPDAICERLQGGVSLFCRAAVMGQIADEAKIYLRLPYSKTLYSMSTGGTQYEE
jgi:hypothetical protein